MNHAADPQARTWRSRHAGGPEQVAREIVLALRRVPFRRVPRPKCAGCNEPWDDAHDAKHAALVAQYPDDLILYSKQEIYSLEHDDDAEIAAVAALVPSPSGGPSGRLEAKSGAGSDEDGREIAALVTEWKRLLAAANPGPWHFPGPGFGEIHREDHREILGVRYEDTETEIPEELRDNVPVDAGLDADAELVVWMRNHAERIIAALDAAARGSTAKPDPGSRPTGCGMSEGEANV